MRRRLAAAGLTVLATALPARAAPGPHLTVSQRSGLDPAGSVVTVTGSGYDVEKGIYVAFCVNNGPGVLPSPCLGGVDLTGSSGSSVWISSDPPDYGIGLAKPYGPGGSFRVRITVRAKDQVTDCSDHRQAPNGCAIVTRNDHTRTDDRSQDVIIPVGFATARVPAPATRSPRRGPSRAPSAAPSRTAAPVSPPPGPAAASTTAARSTTAAPAPVVTPVPSPPVATTAQARTTQEGMDLVPVGVAGGAVVLAGAGTMMVRRRR